MSLIDTGAGVNLITSSLIPLNWCSRIKGKNITQLRTATKQLLLPNGLIFLLLHLGELNTLILIVVALRLAVAILHDTSFIDCFKTWNPSSGT